MAVHGQTRMPNAPAVSKTLSLLVSSLYSFGFETKQLNCQLSKASKLSPSSRLETDCFTSKLTRMMSRVRALSGYGRRICA